jgi:hypothetical protein
MYATLIREKAEGLLMLLILLILEARTDGASLPFLRG